MDDGMESHRGAMISAMDEGRPPEGMTADALREIRSYAVLLDRHDDLLDGWIAELESRPARVVGLPALPPADDFSALIDADCAFLDAQRDGATQAECVRAAITAYLSAVGVVREEPAANDSAER